MRTQAERRLADFTNEDPDFDIIETLRLSIESLRPVVGRSRPQSSMLRHTYIPIKTRSTWFPLYSVTAKASSFLQIHRPDQKGKGDPRKGNAPANPWPKGEGHKGDPYASKGHKGDQYKGHKGDQHMANTDISTGNTVVAEPPDRGRQPADINPTHVRDTRAHKLPLFPSPMYPALPMGGFMQQPMAGMMPQMWPGEMPQGWPQYPQRSRRICESKFASHSELGCC